MIGSSGRNGAFSQFERSEISFEEFCAKFERECEQHGHKVDSSRFVAAIEEETAKEVPEMIAALKKLRERGIKICAVTNNWFSKMDVDSQKRFEELCRLFDDVLESRVLRMNKPDPRLYKLACERMRVPFEETAFLDDIGANLKTAAQLGIKTIRVQDPIRALWELEQLVGFPLLESPPKL